MYTFNLPYYKGNYFMILSHCIYLTARGTLQIKILECVPDTVSMKVCACFFQQSAPDRR